MSIDQLDVRNLFEEDEPYNSTGGKQSKNLYRSQSNRIIFGLCGGLAEYFHLDASIIRLLFLFTLMVGGWAIIIYSIAALLIPNKQEEVEDSFDPNLETKNFKGLLGSVLIVYGIYSLFSYYGLISYLSFLGISPSIYWPLFLITIGICYLVRYKSHSLTKTNRLSFRRSRSNRRIMGVCGGFAEYLEVDSNLIRMLWLILTFATFGVCLFIYIIFSFFIPFQEELSIEK
ncbi:PspC domain-containing protein [Bacteroidota bacterium]